MDSKGKIVFIGKIEKTEKNVKKVAIDITTDSNGKERYVIFQNKQQRFDLIVPIEKGLYKPGDMVSFNYNEPTGNWFPSIWKMNKL